MNVKIVVLGLCIGLLVSVNVRAESPMSWSLQASVRRAVDLAPEMKSAEAEVGKKRGALQQAGAWPNPSLEIQLDDNLGIETGAGGYDMTRVAISQALPFGRLSDQRQQASAALASAEAQGHQNELLLEYKVARRFHAVQLAEAELHLAEQRLQQASHYQKLGSDPLIRYLTPLERMRLDIILQAAKQTVDVAEGEYNEAAASLKTLLGIPLEDKLQVVPLVPVPKPVSMAVLLESFTGHPALEVDKQALASSRAGVAVAKSQRFADPTITLFQEKGYFGNREQDVTGIALNIQIPLWNMNNGRVAQARQAVYQSQSQSLTTHRELRTQLHKSYLHLGHLIEQARHYRDKLLQPAQQVFKLTRKGFAAGELNILSLIDANNTYFDAKDRYQELLQQGWLEMAEVRVAAGLSLLHDHSATYNNKVQKP